MEIQKTSASECTWKTAFVQPENPWQRSSNDSLEAIILQENMVLRLAPDRKRFLWKDTHFHNNLQYHPGGGGLESSNLLLLFQAKAREGVAVALSHLPNYDSQNSFYDLQLGAVGNTTTILKQRKPSRTVSIPSRVCSADSWISYWVCKIGNKVYVGMGEIPGQECIGILDHQNTKNDQTKQESKEEEEEEEATMKDGMEEQDGESNTDKKEEAPMPTDTNSPSQVKQPASNIQYIGFGNAGKGSKAQTLSIQKVILTSAPSSLAETLSNLPAELPVVAVDDEEGNEMKKLMEEYKKECEIRKSRAEKFGTVYKAPKADAFIPWSKAKRLRENPEKGFITGLDMMDPEEVAKREARKARFGISEPDEAANTLSNDLPVTQAWDKEDMLKPQRKDPPSSLWKEPLVEEQRDTFAMELSEPPVLVPEKIHLFAIDWAAFKQIRNKDLMVSLVESNREKKVLMRPYNLFCSPIFRFMDHPTWNGWRISAATFALKTSTLRREPC